MTAFPIKTNDKNSVLSASFGKAKYFVFYDNKDIKIVQNQTQTGLELIAWLAKEGVRSIIIKEIGSSPYKETQKNDIKVLYCDETNLTIKDVINRIDNKKFNLLSDEQIKNINEKKDHSHTHTKMDTNLKKLIFPTDENNGSKSKIGAHFGRAKYYMIITLEKKEISDIYVIENKEDDDTECDDSISGFMALYPSALILSQNDSNPSKGFFDAGLKIYSDSKSITIEESVDRYLNNELKEVKF